MTGEMISDEEDEMGSMLGYTDMYGVLKTFK